MDAQDAQDAQSSGYARPPKATQFQKGRSGNPKGRPKNRRRQIPHDTVLGQMVTVREDGRERRITAAEAFILQLTKKGLEGCGASARATLQAIETARASRSEDNVEVLQIVLCAFGSTSDAQAYGLGVKINRYSKENVRFMLKPWIVQVALARMVDRQLSIEEQQVVVAATLTPSKVQWPEWWSVS